MYDNNVQLKLIRHAISHLNFFYFSNDYIYNIVLMIYYQGKRITGQLNYMFK
jgi:hypothetical protein